MGRGIRRHRRAGGDEAGDCRGLHTGLVERNGGGLRLCAAAGAGATDSSWAPGDEQWVMATALGSRRAWENAGDTWVRPDRFGDGAARNGVQYAAARP